MRGAPCGGPCLVGTTMVAVRGVLSISVIPSEARALRETGVPRFARDEPRCMVRSLCRRPPPRQQFEQARPSTRPISPHHPFDAPPTIGLSFQEREGHRAARLLRARASLRVTERNAVGAAHEGAATASTDLVD